MKILLVEEDILLSAELTKVLGENRYILDLARDGQAGLGLASTVEYDLLLLDVQVPQLDGINLCRQLRSRHYNKPILLLTTSEAEVTAGFEAGADDYLSKPCLPEVWLARIKIWLRRSLALSPQKVTTLTWGDLCLEIESGRVFLREQEISFTPTEYKLLELLLRHPDRIFSRSAILDQLWGSAEAPTDRAVNTYIKDIRKKLKASGLTQEIIETVYGMGYRLKPYSQSAPLAPSQPPQPQPQHQLEITQLFNRFRHVFNERINQLEKAKTALLKGNLEANLQEIAKQEAHKLAGSMASFGYPEASKLARSIEHLLLKESPWREEEIKRLSTLVTALQQEITKPPVTSSTPTKVAAVANYRVLVVDDDEVLTERLKAEADAWGCRFKVVPTLAAARSRLTLSMPDVILLDLSFPAAQEDGLALLQELHNLSPELPVIILTGRDSFGDRLAVSRLGAKRFLPKPATTQEIFSAIASVLTPQQALQATVLILDDDPLALIHLSALLTPWGVEVITETKPQHFWEKLVATSPQLVILDLEMPQISGLELCQVVRQDAQWGNLPILVVTAHTDTDALTQAFAAGADDFIAKPVLGAELVSRVLSRIERKRNRFDFKP